MLNRLFKQGEYINYPQFTCIRNYFGEMRAFYYAWVSFYTAWLCIPIIPGSLFMIYRYVAIQLNSSDLARDAPFPLFAIFMCLWGSIAVSRWRRKQSEIATKWGLVSQLDNPIREKRVEFSGDYYIDTTSFNLKRYTHKTQRCLLLLLSLPILIVLLSISIGIYLFIQEYKQRYAGFVIQLGFGVLNGVSITIINLIYQRIAIWSTQKENYQFLSSFEQVLVFKSFLFKFINSNMSLAYAAYFERNFDSLWYLVVGLLLARMANLFLLGNILPWMLFWVKRKKYFRSLRQLIAARQQISRSTQRLSPVARGKTSSFSNIDKDILRRVVYDFKRNQILSKTPIDSIQMDTSMNKAQLVIHRYAELMVQFGYITMYSVVCPVASLLGLFAGMLELKYGIVFDAKYLQRNVATKSTGIGTWMIIWEFLSILSILATFLLSYIVFPRLQSSYDNAVGFLFLLVLIEHVLVLFRGLIMGGQKRKATWVAHLAERKSQQESESKKMQEVINQRRIQILEFKLQNQKQMKMKEEATVKHLTQNLQKKEGMIEDKELKIQKLKAQIKVENQSKRMSLLYQEPINITVEKRSRFSTGQKRTPLKKPPPRHQIWQNESQSADSVSQETEGSPANDLIKNQVLLEKAYENYKSDPSDVTALLLETLALKLVDITAQRVESQIRAHRLGLVSGCLTSKSDPLVLCSQCAVAPSTSKCRECLDYFCQKCFDDIHLQTRLLHQKLDIVQKTLYSQFATNTFSKLSKLDQSFLGTKGKKKKGFLLTETEQKQQWLKFQYFSFPTHKDAPHFKQMEAYFTYLYQEYVSKNLIKETREDGRVLDLETFLIHPCRTVLLTPTMTQALDLKLFESTQLGPIGFSHLNDEEKLFLNRIMHKLLRSALTFTRDIFYPPEGQLNEKYEVGAGRSISNRRNATFAEFMKDVKKLQNGTFEQKLLLFSNLLDQDSSGVIERDTLSQFLNSLLLQNVTTSSETKFYSNESHIGKQGIDLVISLLFEGKYDRIDKSQFFQSILAEERAMDLMKVALQDFTI